METLSAACPHKRLCGSVLESHGLEQKILQAMDSPKQVAVVSLAIALLIGAAAAQTPAIGPISGPSQLSNTAFSANGAPVVDVAGGWREGRATFYDAPEYFQQVSFNLASARFSSVLIL